MKQPFSVVFTMFRSLSLDHLERSLFSLSKQTVFQRPPCDSIEMLIFDNDTEFSQEQIWEVTNKHFDDGDFCFPRIHHIFDKHGDKDKRNASYAQNKAIRWSPTDTFIHVKADCIYAEDFCEKLLARKTANPMEFVAPWMYQMAYWSEHSKPHSMVDHAKDLEGLNWREDVRRLNQNTVNGQLHNHASIDAPSFCTTKQAMERAGWYDEDLREWSYWQIDLQSNMDKRGVQIKVIPEVLVWHTMHGLAPEDGERNLKKAHAHWLASPRRNDPAFR